MAKSEIENVSKKLKEIQIPLTNCYDLLEMIRRRPKMYLGKPSITALYQFLWGIEFALKHIDIEKSNFDWKQFKPEKERQYLFGFQNWIGRKLLNQDKSAYNWDYVILCKTKGDESKALDLFFALLEEFKLEKEDLDLEIRQ